MAADHRLAQHESGEEGMVARRLTKRQEAALVDDVERARANPADEWDLSRPLAVTRGPSPTAVLSVRVPIEQLRDIRRIAAQRGVSVSELLQTAVTVAVGMGGPRVDWSGWLLRLSGEPETSKSYPDAGELTWTLAPSPAVGPTTTGRS